MAQNLRNTNHSFIILEVLATSCSVGVLEIQNPPHANPPSEPIKNVSGNLQKDMVEFLLYA